MSFLGVVQTRVSSVGYAIRADYGSLDVLTDADNVGILRGGLEGYAAGRSYRVCLFKRSAAAIYFWVIYGLRICIQL